MATAIRDPQSGRIIKWVKEPEAVDGDFSAVDRVILGMLITYYSENDADRQRKIMESFCQLSFWLWGWNVQSFHENFTALRQRLLREAKSVSYRFSESGVELS